jgi:hypothetical protein
MYVSDSNLVPQLAALGNIDGDQLGDCLIRLPGGGQHQVASADLRLYTEGVVGRLPDGRRFFCHVSGLLVIDRQRNGANGANGNSDPGGTGPTNQEPQQ